MTKKKSFVASLSGWLALAMMLALVIIPACGGGGPAGPNPVPTPGPTATPGPTLISTQPFEINANQSGFSTPGPPSSQAGTTGFQFVAQWDQADQNVLFFLLNDQSAKTACYNSNFTCPQIVKSSRNTERPKLLSVTKTEYGDRLFPWVVTLTGRVTGRIEAYAQ